MLSRVRRGVPAGMHVADLTGDSPDFQRCEVRAGSSPVRNRCRGSDIDPRPTSPIPTPVSGKGRKSPRYGSHGLWQTKKGRHVEGQTPHTRISFLTGCRSFQIRLRSASACRALPDPKIRPAFVRALGRSGRATLDARVQQGLHRSTYYVGCHFRYCCKNKQRIISSSKKRNREQHERHHEEFPTARGGAAGENPAAFVGLPSPRPGYAVPASPPRVCIALHSCGE